MFAIYVLLWYIFCMRKSIRNIGATLIATASLGVASSPLVRASICGVPDYIQSRVSRILSKTPPHISNQQKHDNSKVDFLVAQNEIVTQWYAQLCSSAHGIFETGWQNKEGRTHIGSLRARTVTGLQQIVREIRKISHNPDMQVLITGGSESGKKNKHIDSGKSHSQWFKLDLSFSEKAWLNDSAQWLLPWLSQKIHRTPHIFSRYRLSLDNGQMVDVYYEPDHLDIRFL